MALISLLLLLFASIWFNGTPDAAAFTPAPCWSSRSKSKSSSRRYLFWFTAKKDEPRNNNSNNNNSDKNDSNSNIASVTQVMDSMDDLKRVQDVGKLTATLLEELDRLVIEGSAANGKVKVLFDGQQRPKGVDLDDAFLASADTDDIQSAVTKAMKDAHAKSLEKMEEKVKALYAELGLAG